MSVFKEKLIYIICFFCINIHAQKSDFYITSHTTLESLPNNRITSIAKDNNGFLWIGTENGLYQYDGYNFELHCAPEEIGINNINTSIECIYPDSHNNLWIGTKAGGIFCYNLKTYTFKQYAYIPDKKDNIHDTRINTFYEDRDSNIWIGGWSNGICKFDNLTKEFHHYNKYYTNKERSNIGDIIELKNGDIYAAGYFGLWKYNKQKNIIDSLSVEAIVKNKKGYMGLISFTEDTTNKRLWIGSWENGLYEYNYLKNIATRHLPTKKQIINNPGILNIYSIFNWTDDKMLIGTWGAGLWVYDIPQKAFIKVPLKTSYNYCANVIRDIFKDNENNLWIASDKNGLFKLNNILPFKNTQLDWYEDQPEIVSAVEDEKGNVFATSTNKGLYIISEDNKSKRVLTHWGDPIYESYLVHKNNLNKIWVSGNCTLFEVSWQNKTPILIPLHKIYNFPKLNICKISSITEKDSLLYIGTLENSLFLFNKQNNKYFFSKEFKSIPNTLGYLQNESIQHLLTDSKQRVWVATNCGLHYINENQEVLHSNEIFINEQRLANNQIQYIHENNLGQLFVLSNTGLHLLTELEPGKFSVNRVTQNEKGNNQQIYSITEDNKNNIWCSNANSIVKYNLEGETYAKYFKKDGIKMLPLSKTVLKRKDGTINYFTHLGYITFNPDALIKANNNSELKIKSFNILNKEIKPGTIYNGRILLNKNINNTNYLNLKHNDKEFSFLLSHLDFNHERKHHYTYILENYNSDWVDIGERRHISFNNLKPGNYKFRAKALNEDGSWVKYSNPITINISAPWWKTWYAIILFLTLIAIAIVIIRWSILNQLALKRNLDLLKLKIKKDEEVNEIKYKFFTNISHEFRTPLTLILAPLSDILKNVRKHGISSEANLKLKVIEKNSKKLLNMVNQLLDFRKIDNEKLKLQVHNMNIIELLEEIALSFSEIASQNNIQFYLINHSTNNSIWCDIKKIEIVINNLLSNSFKNINSNGNIKIIVNENEDNLIVSVVDNGKGIPKSEIKYIFDRFYQGEGSENQGGSGIGLTLAKQFIELHKGKIEVSSIPYIKTEFSIYLKKGNKHFSDENTIITKYYQQKESTKDFLKKTTNNKGKIVLIVEDNIEVRDYLQLLLSENYITLSARNGLDAINCIKDKKPDIIISDIMMPELDGFELCKYLKENIETQLIPIILLTAKPAEHYKTLGIKYGADDYISKPFDPELLLEKISSILNSLQLLKENYSNTVKVEGSNVEITLESKEFLTKLINVIEANMLNPELGTIFLTEEFNLSKSTLYRKIKNASGMTLNQLIKKVKLDRAAQLLKDESKTITEIVYEVGFNDVKHFREIFNQQFEMSPSKYRKSLKKDIIS